MLHYNSDVEWEKFGKTDPYYGVMVNDRFHIDRLKEEDLKDFFGSGHEHVDFLFETIRKSIDPKFLPSKALDFGCGVGRCAIPLAQICDEVVGVDISDSMLKEASKNSLKNLIKNLELVRSDDSLSSVSGRFDFIHSFSTFQHISEKRGQKIFKRLIDLLSDNGVAALEFVYHHKSHMLSRFIGSIRKNIPFANNLINVIYKRSFSEPLMEKNIYDIKQLLLILHNKNCGNLNVRFFNNGPLRNVILFFQKREDKIPLLNILSK